MLLGALQTEMGKRTEVYSQALASTGEREILSFGLTRCYHL